MIFITLLLIRIAIILAAQTQEEAAVAARELLYRESVAILGSVYAKEVHKELAGKPFGIISYYVDCSENGTPYMLLSPIETNMRNFLEGGSALSLSVSPSPSGPYFSFMKHGRMSLTGTVTKITSKKEIERVDSCFLKRHPDAQLWKPSTGVHSSAYYTFDIDSIYWVGGFGSVAYIGYIPLDMYHSINRDEAAKAQHEAFQHQQVFDY